MTPERWAEVRAGVEALMTKLPEDREAFLQNEFGDDAMLRAEVEAQASACEIVSETGDFMAQSAASFAAPIFAGDAHTDSDRDPGPNSATITEMELRTALAGQYEVERELGRGGTATVYLARDHRHGRLVALKVLEPAVGAAMSAERFLHEIHVTAGLTHPHILPLHDSGVAGGLLYYVMPFIDGETLRSRLAGGNQLSIDAARRLIREVASALAYAHRRGVIHRDIKPENILLEDGHAVVADFGIARAVRRAQEAQEAQEARDIHGDTSAGASNTGVAALTQAGMIPGTPAYMAPEQARGNADVDQRADIYALGVVAYEALAGAHPFGARSRQAMAVAHATELPAPLVTQRPDIPPALAALVMRALEKDPDARPQTVTEIIALLDDEKNGAPQPRDGRWSNIMTHERAHVARVVSALAAAACVVVFSAWIGQLGPFASSGGANLKDRPVMTAVVSGGEAKQRGTADLEAYELYLKGHYYWTQRGSANIARSIMYFQQAIARDSLFARAHAGLALAYSSLPGYVPDPTDSTNRIAISTEKATELTRLSAERAVALDSTLADAQLAMAIGLDMRLQFRDALGRYRTATALDPSSVTAHHWLGMSLLNLGHTDEALVELRHASELDPMAPAPASALATALLFGRRFRDADAAARRSLALDSTFALAIYTLGVAQALGGQPDSAVVTLEHGMAIHPDDARIASALVFAYAGAGHWDNATKLRTKLHDPAENHFGWAETEIADLVFGNRDPLVRTLSSAAGQRRLARAGGIFGCNPLLDPLWTDARFRTAMRKLGVSECVLARPGPLMRRPGA